MLSKNIRRSPMAAVPNADRQARKGYPNHPMPIDDILRSAVGIVNRRFFFRFTTTQIR